MQHCLGEVYIFWIFVNSKGSFIQYIPNFPKNLRVLHVLCVSESEACKFFEKISARTKWMIFKIVSFFLPLLVLKNCLFERKTVGVFLEHN